MSTANEPAAHQPAAPTRLCGRCRKPSDRDPADLPGQAATWFLCPPCREVLLGGTGRGRKA
jgi:hypothetical protein